MAMSGALARQENAWRDCRSWVDPALRVEFPERLGGLQMTSRTTYNGDDDYSLRYELQDGRNPASGGRRLDLFVYTRAERPTADGAGDEVAKEIEDVDAIIRQTHVSGNFGDGS
ncbi:MAG: hypothetical protein IKU71_08235 [Kiritimatiellae bacterium]|nr:hypothetical protein [Kiritimatiellia bacterium]